MSMRTGVVLLGAVIVLASSRHAVTAAAQFPRGLLAASQDGGCVIETRPVTFGNYDTANPVPLDSQGQIIFTCSPVGGSGSIKNVRINISRGQAGSYDRSMAGGSARLRYNLYLDSTRQQIWGDGTSGTDYYFDPHPSPNTPYTLPIYGRVLALQAVPLGSYADSLQIELLF